jgi:zinc protease
LDVSGSALSRDADLLLEILVEALVSPVFPGEELDKEKKRMVGAIRQSQDQTSARAAEEAMRRVYPPEHALHLLTGEERIARVEALRREDLALHAEHWGAGSLPGPRGRRRGRPHSRPARAGPRGWGTGTRFEPAVPPPSPCRETVSMPDKASADVILAAVGPEAHRRGVPRVLDRATPLGQSSLTSRQRARARYGGLTYGIHSSLGATHLAGPFVVSLTVKPESRDAALASTLDEIRNFLVTGLTEKELAEEKSSRTGRFKVDLGSNAGMASALDAAIYYGFGVPYLEVPGQDRRRDEGAGRCLLRAPHTAGKLHDRVGGQFCTRDARSGGDRRQQN